MKVLKIEHIGIAVKNNDAAKKLFGEILGLHYDKSEIVAEQKVKTTFFEVGDTHVELLEATSPDSTIAKYIAKNGEGIQHIAFSVENIEESLAELKASGIQLIDEKPRRGAGGAKIAFLHPKSTFGVLIELCEK
ncbi:MAG: methylmalonyl-CoA epimerase [Smithella sp.]|nr:methylmalonyl-CoA epimerase [Syntrophaceae bacterium]